MAFAAAHAAGQALGGVARLQVLGVEMRRLPGRERQGDGAAPLPSVVDGVDRHHAATVVAVDDSSEALPTGLGGGQEQWNGAVVRGERDLQLVGACV